MPNLLQFLGTACISCLYIMRSCGQHSDQAVVGKQVLRSYGDDTTTVPTHQPESTDGTHELMVGACKGDSVEEIEDRLNKLEVLQQNPISNMGKEKAEIATIERHKDKVFALAVAGDILYTASESKDMRAFRAPRFDEVDCFGSGNGIVQSLMAHGDRLYSAHQDNRIRVWRRIVASNSILWKCRHKLVATLPRLRHYVRSLLLDKKYVQVRRHKRKLWIEHSDTISALALGRCNDATMQHQAATSRPPPPNVLYSASWDKTVKVWSLRNLKPMESFQAHHDAINAMIIINATVLATASADCTIKLWARIHPPRKRHVLISTLHGHKAAVNALAVSANSKTLYSGSSDASIMVWKKVCSSPASPSQLISHGSCKVNTVKNTLAFRMKTVLAGHSHAVLSVSAVGNHTLCSSSADKSIRVWRKEEGCKYECLVVLAGHGGPVKAIASITPDQGHVDLHSSYTSANTNSKCVPDGEGCDGSAIVVYSAGLDSKVKVWAITLQI